MLKIKDVFVLCLLSGALSIGLSAENIVLTHPQQGAKPHQTIPYFSWEHELEGYFTGYYEIMIASDPEFTSLVDRDTIPAFIKYYSPDFELAHETPYFWRVRFLDNNFVPDTNDWTAANSFSIDQPCFIVDVEPHDGWDEIRSKWQAVLNASVSFPCAVELRFPENHVFHIRQDSNEAASEPNYYLLFINGYDDIIINGRGSKIILEAGLDICGFLQARNSSGMQVKDIIIDYHPNSLFQFGGKVKDFDTQAQTFQVVVDTTVYKNFEEMKAYSRGYFIDQERQQRLGRLGVEYGMVETWEQARIHDTLFQFTAGASEWGRYRDDVKDGDYFVSSHRAGDIIILWAEVNDFVVNNTTSHGCRGRFFIIRQTNRGSYIRCVNNNFLRTQGRIMGSPSGGVNDKGFNVWYENNRFEYTRDDTYHNGEIQGEGAVFRRNYIIGAFRNSIWVQANRSWVSENTIEFAGIDAIQLGFTPDRISPSNQVNVGLIENNKIIRPNLYGINATSNINNPDPETGYFNTNIIIRNNHMSNHFRNQAIRLEYLKNAIVENNVILQNTVYDWSVYSDPELQLGIHISHSENVSGTGNQVMDARITSGNMLRIEENCVNVDVSLLNKNLDTPTNLMAHEVVYNRVDLRWKDNASGTAHYKITRRTNKEAFYSLIDTVDKGVTKYSDQTVHPTVVYHYRVIAVNQGGASYPSNELIIATPHDTETGLISGTDMDSFAIYPNPSRGTFWLSTVSDFRIYTINGQLVMQETGKNKIDLTGHPSGLYLLKNKLNGNVYKLIKN